MHLAEMVLVKIGWIKLRPARFCVVLTSEVFMSIAIFSE
jgi:hypothetical protein